MFYLFAGVNYYPAANLRDCVATAETPEELLDLLLGQDKIDKVYDWWTILNGSNGYVLQDDFFTHSRPIDKQWHELIP